MDTAEKTEIQNSIRQIRKNQQDLESSMKILAQKDIKLKELDTELRVKKVSLLFFTRISRCRKNLIINDAS